MSTTRQTQVPLTIVADEHGVSVVTLRRWISEGVRGVRLAAHFYGGRWWTTPEAVEAFIAESTRRRVRMVAPRRAATETRRYLKDRYGL